MYNAVYDFFLILSLLKLMLRSFCKQKRTFMILEYVNTCV